MAVFLAFIVAPLVLCTFLVVLHAVIGAVWRSISSRPAAPTGTSTKPKEVVVIGAGASGLVFADELQKAGHKVFVFDKQAVVGGVYATAYAGAQLTTSSVQTAFSSFPHGEEATPSMWPVGKYQKYLESFVQAKNLKSALHLSTEVVSVSRPGGNGSKWTVVTRDWTGESTTRVVDAVAVCSGAHQAYKRPTFEGEEAFAGQILHSAQYSTPDAFKGKRVLLVGCGESGSDIALMVARVAKSSALSTRNGPGYVIPRMFAGRVTDLDTNRVYHSLPRWLAGGWLMKAKVALESLFITKDDDVRVLKLASQFNAETGLPWQRRYGVKNTSFLTAMLDHGMVSKPQIQRVTSPSTVEFTDGTTFEADAIVCCTGYRLSFPFLPSDLSCHVSDARNLFKHAYPTGLPSTSDGSIVFAGLARPGVGSIPPLSELLARHFTSLVTGTSTLPSNTAAVIEADRKRELALFPRDGKRLSALVDYQQLATDLATMVGCMPPLRKLFFTHPTTWAKVLFGPLCAAQYRLADCSPDADAAQARAVLDRVPTMPLPILAFEGAVLAGCKVLSSVGMSSLTPIGV